MNSKLLSQGLRIPSLLLAAALQVLPIVRVALPAAETAGNVLAIIFRWTVGTAAALGGVHAVSGASTKITNPLNVKATNGIPFSLRLTTAPDQAHYWTATSLPAGLALTGTSGQTLWKIEGTPTATGTYNVGLTAKDQATSGASRTVTATLILNIGSLISRPVITSQPASQTVTQSQGAVFTVAATGTAPLSYQWRFQGADLPTKTATNLVLSGVTTNDAGNYDVVVTNTSGSVTSSIAVLKVIVPAVAPTITVQPVSLTVTQGQTAGFSVTATGTAPLTYFWRKGTTVISLSITPNLGLSNVQLADAGNYSVIVSNSAGTAVSSPATLTVNPAPQAPFISTPPTDQFVASNGSATFSVAAGGTAPLYFEWYLNNNLLPGENSSSLTVGNVQALDQGSYVVVITNLYGSITSSVAALTLVAPPVITGSPQSRTNLTGSTATFTVSASSAAPLSYQWQKDGISLLNGGPIFGAQSNVLTITALQTNHTGNYLAIVSNIAGAVTSQVAVLKVVEPPPVFAPLVVQLNGPGSVNPNYNGQLLQVGKRYSITATPGSNYVFANWSGGATTPTLNFVMQSNLVLQANFIPATVTFLNGNYHGLFYESTGVSHLTSGSFIATTTARGAYSAKVILAGHRYAMAGQFTATGRATNSINRGIMGTVTVELAIDSGNSDQLHGLFKGETWGADLLADRAVFDAKANPAPQAGAYTLALPGAAKETTSPAGSGVCSVTIDSSGRIKMKGTLADGSKVNQSSALSGAGDWPLYVSLYSGQGSTLGWLSVLDQSASDINGTINWSRGPQPSALLYPAGFVVQRQAIGSRYVAPAAGVLDLNFSQGYLVLTDGNLSQNLTNRVAIDLRNRVTGLAGSALKMSIQTSTGFFKGNLPDPATGKALSFNGVLLQKQNLGWGFFLGDSQSGNIYFGP